MLIPHRGQAERLVLARILFVSDADQRFLEQLDDGGEHLLAREPWPRQIPGRSPSQFGQGFRERDHAVVLGVVASLAPLWMISILFSASRVAPRRLQVALRIRAYPDIRPGRGNHERANAAQLLLVADRPVVR